MANIVSANFRYLKKTGCFVYRMDNLFVNDKIIVRTRRGVELAVVTSIEKIDDIKIPEKLEGLILRKIDKSDSYRLANIEQAEEDALKKVKDKIAEYNLNMKVIKIEYMFDMKKMVLYFSSDERMDYSLLLHSVVNILNIAVEFQQVSVREGAGIIGGIGICGKSLCCKTFLRNFKNIHAQSIINQGMIISSSKFCGICGRLMCCLKYEEDMYIENAENLPKIDDIVITPRGHAVVLEREILSRKVKVSLINDREPLPVIFDINDLKKID
ncbi:MAG: hypothetical protein LBJ32_02895 [Oscillospiraceae bacterium]|jgi:cell fate regulator YaaT (PSP1 superfamily)|nr:hypothetical protein [Oscillospiraceae bacterium]